MKCPDCDGKIGVDAIRCRDCGKDLTTLDLAGLQKKSNEKKRKVIILGLIVALFIGVGAGTKTYLDKERDKRIAKEEAQKQLEELKRAQEAEKAEQDRIEAEKNDYSWVPKGFEKFTQNYNVAYKQIGYDAADCYQERCFGMVVITRDYCSTLSIEGNFVRKSDETLVDRDSDYAYNVNSGQRVILKLETSQEAPNYIRFTEVKCR